MAMHHSEEHKMKMSILHKGDKNPFFGKTHTKEVRDRISKANKGKPSHRKGKKLSEEHKQKLSENSSKPWLGKRLSEEHKTKISLGRIGKYVGTNNPQFGIPKTEEHKRKLSIANIGKTSPNKGKPMSEQQKEKISKARIGKYGGENNPRWLGGISFEPYCPKFNDILKEKIRERDNRTCQHPDCGCKENGKKHSVHHIHYDKPNCNPDLITLCNSCNFKVNKNRDYWEEYFMKLLKERGLLLCEE